jgi:prepilin-type N-terminal cleavage/methylation domain-containing protein
MKKGFTLIEVIAAIAIFSIAILAISMAFSTSLNISQMNDIKQDTSQYAQAITEKSKNLIDAGSTKTYDDPIVFYFYDIDDINTCVENIFNSDDISGYKNQNGNNEDGDKFQYAASIKIAETDSSIYEVNVSVWKIGKETQSKSVRDIYEGSD